MCALAAADLVRVWECGLDADLTSRMLVLLGAACPGTGEDELAELPVGRRDALLLDLRALLFGPELTAVVQCPGCDQTLESTFAAEQLRIEPTHPAPSVQHMKLDGLAVSFRLPSSSDLLLLTGSDTGSARSTLLAQCVLDARGADGNPVGCEALPEAVVSAISERMSAADPQADVELVLACPYCDRAWAVPFDIAGFLWAEIHAWVLRLLRDVHVLARAYGWREPDVLALSPVRRSVYLELSRQ